MIMVDVVECACQVGVKNPHPPGFPAQGLEQRSYRVVAAATRPEPIASGLEPGLPLGLQRLPDPGLVAPVQDHWDGRFILPLLQSRFWMFPVCWVSVVAGV